MTAEDVRKVLLRACKEAGSQRKWAIREDFSPSYVGDVINGVRPPSHRILAALGITITYQKAERGNP
jgi:hypothetical protein